MNKALRTRMEAVLKELESINKSAGDAYERMPPNLQMSSKGEMAENDIGALLEMIELAKYCIQTPAKRDE
jgi:hypothetical protein